MVGARGPQDWRVLTLGMITVPQINQLTDQRDKNSSIDNVKVSNDGNRTPEET